MNKPKNIGTAAETAVVKVLRVNGFPGAERAALAGKLDRGDITGTPLIAWEVKGGEAAKAAMSRPQQITEWMKETEIERQNSSADIGVLVVARRGFGALRADKWWAVLGLPVVTALTGRGNDIGEVLAHERLYAPTWMELVDMTIVLRIAGYGDLFA